MEPGALDLSNDAGRCVARFRTTLGSATLVMLALSWPLWIENASFPRVPFVAGLPNPSMCASWAIFGVLLAALGAATAGVAPRVLLGVSVGVMSLLILQDQHRLQPWVLQFATTGLLVTLLPANTCLRYVRVWFVATYVHSGLSKLDYSFCHEIGARLLTTALGPLHIDPWTWPPLWRNAAILAMPGLEIAAALALVFPATRRAGVVAAVSLHAALIGILGPSGLRHSTIVLVWNAAVLVEVAVVFGMKVDLTAATNERVGLAGRVMIGVLWCAVVLPLAERAGLYDTWPAHGLYASHAEWTEVDFLEEESGLLPEAARRHLRGSADSPWVRLDLTGWSREVRGVPVYPQGRACNGLAEALAARYGGRLSIRMIQWGRAERWAGRREHKECLGLIDVRQQGNRYWLNAHPAGIFLDSAAANAQMVSVADRRPDEVTRALATGSSTAEVPAPWLYGHVEITRRAKGILQANARTP